jgi:hypothetical protein
MQLYIEDVDMSAAYHGRVVVRDRSEVTNDLTEMSSLLHVDQDLKRRLQGSGYGNVLMDDVPDR